MGYPPPMETPREYFTAREVAKHYHIGYSRVLSLLRSGQIRSIKIGNGYRVSLKALLEWEETMEKALKGPEGVPGGPTMPSGSNNAHGRPRSRKGLNWDALRG